MKKTLLFILLIISTFVMIGCTTKPGSKIKIDPNQNSSGQNNNNQNNNNNNTEDPPTPNQDEEKKREKVYLGIDLIDENLSIFEGKRVGLITNATGINSNFQSTIDILYAKTNLKALFAPEHGIRGANAAGGTVTDETDPVTKLPVYSLYGSTQAPTKEMLDNIDIMCIDIQDVGARFYTYIYTMAYAMQACKTYNKEFVVFDRPNPVSGSVVEGTILDTTYSSFIGLYPIVQRHGMTIGEIAKYFNEEERIGCNLTVIKMKNWNRDMYFDECDVPWVLPSPNMPTLDTAIVYTGTCLFEGTNLSEGRGTTRPFELIGAPWIDSIALANELNSLGLNGVYFRPASFTPTTSKFSGKQCFGVQVHVTNRYTFESVKTGYAMLEVIRTMYPDDFQILSASSNRCTLNLLTGCSYITAHKYTLEQQFKLIDAGSKEFTEKRAKYLLY